MASATSFRATIGIPPSKANPSDSALVIIDAQNEYVSGKLAVSNADTSRAAISDLLSRYRKAGGKIVHVTHQVPDGAPVFTPGTDLAKEFDELQPKSGEITVTKQFPGSFTKTDLDDLLKKESVKKVVLCGYMAHVCVSTTAREASQLGYDVLLAEDAISDRDIPGASGNDVTKMVMLELGDAFGTVVKSADIA
ncbi:MAG: hypothetical protein M1821_003117 [Bathelium mastoideum]|nr:MAG: hypothetical protein M1821_003117 [Bathelium mastoideum]